MSTTDTTTEKPLVVLLVVEELVPRFFMTEFLEDTGFTVIETASTEEAYLALTTRPDINAAIVELARLGPTTKATLAEMIAVQFPRIALFLTVTQASDTVELPPRSTVLSIPYEPAAIAVLIRQAVEQYSGGAESPLAAEDKSAGSTEPSLSQ